MESDYSEKLAKALKKEREAAVAANSEKQMQEVSAVLTCYDELKLVCLHTHTSLFIHN
jgi:hypothetical protein